MIRRLLLALFALALCAGACQPGAGDDTAADEATMAVLGQVRALHQQADIYEARGDYEHASAAIRRVLATDFPRGMQEAEDVRADANGRLAELALRAGAPDQALDLATTGIAGAGRETVLRARLFMVRGQALGALAERATAAGDPAGAERRRTEALESLETSIQINQRVLGRLTDAGAR